MLWWGASNYEWPALNNALYEQINLKNEIDKFNDFTRPESQNEKEENTLTYENVMRFLEGRQKVFNAFKSKIFPLKNQTLDAGIKMLTHKQML